MVKKRNYIACISHHAEMVETMKKVVKMGANLTIEERNLLSVSYKNAIGARRTAWRAIYTAVMQHKVLIIFHY